MKRGLNMANLSSENKIMETWNKDLPKVSISYIAYNHETMLMMQSLAF